MSRQALLLLTLVILSSLLSSQIASTPSSSPSGERELPFSLGTVQAALKQMNAYQGARLPSLGGFVEGEPSDAPAYQHPYYEFKFDLKPISPDRTIVSVQANISAWYADPKGSNSGYQQFKSNGRLEADLLDRLNSFLTGNPALSAVEVQREIETVHKQKAEAEQRSAELETRLRTSRVSGEGSSAEYVEVARSHTPVLSAPEIKSSIVLRAEAEDAFKVLERRGAWVKVALEGDRTGWMQNSLVKSSKAEATGYESARARQLATGAFNVIRENASLFSGDWRRLKDKQVLYIWARAEESAVAPGPAEKLRFAEHIFLECYERAAHDSKNAIEGIVVIFLDERGGVAAASLDDVRSWADGGLTSTEFLKRCSLDPPGAFSRSLATAQRRDSTSTQKPGR